LVPRHPERGRKIKKLIDQRGINCAVRSEKTRVDDTTQVYLADTLGELGLWYRLSNNCFIGGSLTKIGGHNPFEAILLNNTILHGPNTFNFEAIYSKLIKTGASIEVKDSHSLYEAIKKLIQKGDSDDLAGLALKNINDGANLTEKVSKEILVYI